MISSKLVETIPKSIRVLRKLSSESFHGELTFPQIRALKLIEEGQGQTQMAETLQVTLAATSKMINCLLKKKLISKKSGQDRRTQILKLTSKGRATLAKVKIHVEKKLDIGIDDLSKEEKAQLIQGLIVLEKLMIKMKEV